MEMKKGGGARGTTAQRLRDGLSLELIRNVVERRAEFGPDVRQGSNSCNGDQCGEQAVFDRGRALAVSNQLQELAHGPRSYSRVRETVRSPTSETGSLPGFGHQMMSAKG
jgi:hypothetical protein